MLKNRGTNLDGLGGRKEPEGGRWDLVSQGEGPRTAWLRVSPRRFRGGGSGSERDERGKKDIGVERDVGPHGTSNEKINYLFSLATRNQSNLRGKEQPKRISAFPARGEWAEGQGKGSENDGIRQNSPDDDLHQGVENEWIDLGGRKGIARCRKKRTRGGFVYWGGWCRRFSIVGAEGEKGRALDWEPVSGRGV